MMKKKIVNIVISVVMLFMYISGFITGWIGNNNYSTK